MTIEEYEDLICDFTYHRKGVSESKREDYTKSSQDVLANFKGVAKASGLDPLQVWLVYSHKQWDAICNYVKTGGQSESEPIRERFADLANYLELGYALIKENYSISVQLSDEVKKLNVVNGDNKYKEGDEDKLGM